MSALRLALDEDVPHRVAGLLRASGYPAYSAKELGRLGLSDVQVLLRASENRQTLVTHNGRDFRALHEAWVMWRERWTQEVADVTGRSVDLSRHAGILVTPHLPIADLARILVEIALIAESMDDRLFMWNAAQQWHEPLLSP